MIRKQELKDSLGEVLDIFTNLTRIPPIGHITQAVKRARNLLGIKSTPLYSKQKKILEKYRYVSRFNIELKCRMVEKITCSFEGGGPEVIVKLSGVNTADILAELYDLFGEDLLIDFIKNG